MPATAPGSKLINPIAPVIRNTMLETVITTGVGLTGWVSPVIQNVGFKKRLISTNTINENAKSVTGIVNEKIASLRRDFALRRLFF